MRKDLRGASGLGSPPTQFTTNGSESINAALKRKVNHKESDWPQFNEHLKAYVESQREEILRALSGRGQYRLNLEFAHYGVSTQEWIKMRTDQRQQVLEIFQKATLPVHAKTSREPEPEEVPAVGLAQTQDRHMSIRAEDSGITTIPHVTLDALWVKAEQILQSLNAITPAPGENKKARMVLSYSQATPHHVQTKSDGQYVCDSACLQWASSQICSHTIAAAESNGELASFLQWYTKCAESPNISTLAMSGLPRGRGKKGGKPKRQRAKQTRLPPDNYALRPGLLPTGGGIMNAGGIVNTGAIVNLTTAPQPVSVSVVTTQSTMPASLGPQCAYAIPVTCAAVNISTPQPTISRSDVHPPPVSSGPPPLIHTPQANVNPFYLKPLSGNIRVCQGCRGSLRLPNGSVPAPPFDIVVARMEKRSFRDSDGTLRTPMRPSAAHYHARLTCIRAVEPNFVASTLRVPADVSQFLTPQHHQHLNLEFGL